MSGSPFHSTLLFERFKVSTPSFELPEQQLSDFERKVLNFTQAWLSEKETFEFQTSGSTGTPQRMSFHRNEIRASVRLTQQTFELLNGQKALLCLDPDFIAGKMMIARALEIGLDLHCLAPSADPLQSWKPEPIKFAAMVPYQLEAILQSGTSIQKLSHIDTIIVGGSAVSTQLENKLQNLPTRFYETYGMTETLTHIAIRKLNPAEKEFHTLPGVKISLDQRLCLNIQVEHLGPETIQTNDLVTLLASDSFQVIGRYDNIINTAGIKVSPESVESKIAEALHTTLPGIDYFIVGEKDESFG